MTELTIGDEVYIRNFENQKLTVEKFDREHVNCIYLNRNNEFMSIQVRFELLIKKNHESVTVPGKKHKSKIAQ